ncbi:MAG: diphthine--ammonia ligase [Nanoarchaeota archaeon]|nr:diphthine--ammonia ligase [Nanoarchaeota archaeon]
MDTLNTIKQALITAVKTRIPNNKFGILFSGGLDSTIIAKICKDLNADFTCYTAAFNKEAIDIQNAKHAAEALGFELKTTIASPEETLKKVKPITNGRIQTGVAMPLYAACEMAKKDNIKVILSGTGADELFAGYARYKKSTDLNNDCEKDFIAVQTKDLIRDETIAKLNELQLIAPFMDKEVARLALALPKEQKIGEHNKLILRQIAISIGIPEDIAMKPKKAAQYGSGSDKILKKLMKPMKLGALFSSGKDSSYALYLMKKQGCEISCLITIKSKNKDSFMFHTPAIEMASLQSKAMGIPILFHETKGEKEIELKDLELAIKSAKGKYQIQGIITGALYSEYQSERISKIADKLGLKVFSPLWHKSQEEEMREIIKQGFEFILTSIAADGLDKSWLGRKITMEDVDKLVKINQKNGLNIAFEGGEAESLVLNAPFFKKRIVIEESKIQMENTNTGRLVIEKAELKEK